MEITKLNCVACNGTLFVFDTDTCTIELSNGEKFEDVSNISSFCHTLICMTCKAYHVPCYYCSNPVLESIACCDIEQKDAKLELYDTPIVLMQCIRVYERFDKSEKDHEIMNKFYIFIDQKEIGKICSTWQCNKCGNIEGCFLNV